MAAKSDLSNQERIDLVREYIQSGMGYRPFYEQNKDRIPVAIRSWQDWCTKYRHIASIEGGQLYDKHDIKGTSTLYDKEGNVRLQWVKTSKEAEDIKEQLRAFADTLSDRTPCYDPIKPPKERYDASLINYIPLVDMHIGLYCWKDQTGDDFNLEIAQRNIRNCVDYLMNKMPEAEKCYIANLGDFFHADNLAGVTSRSGHILDMASHSLHMYRVGQEMMMYFIEQAAKRHNHVELVSCAGNHDDMLTPILAENLRIVYKESPHIHIRPAIKLRQYIRHGKCLIGNVHGDKTKDSDLPLLMAQEVPEDWGATSYRWFHRGHHHQDKGDVVRIKTTRSFTGCKVVQFEQMTPSDGYAIDHAYVSGKSQTSITYDAHYGITEENPVGLDRIRDMY